MFLKINFNELLCDLLSACFLNFLIILFLCCVKQRSTCNEFADQNLYFAPLSNVCKFNHFKIEPHTLFVSSLNAKSVFLLINLTFGNKCSLMTFFKTNRNPDCPCNNAAERSDDGSYVKSDTLVCTLI